MITEQSASHLLVSTLASMSFILHPAHHLRRLVFLQKFALHRLFARFNGSFPAARVLLRRLFPTRLNRVGQRGRIVVERLARAGATLLLRRILVDREVVSSL